MDTSSASDAVGVSPNVGILQNTIFLEGCGRVGDKIRYDYYAMFNFFNEIGTVEDEPPVKSHRGKKNRI